MTTAKKEKLLSELYDYAILADEIYKASVESPKNIETLKYSNYNSKELLPDDKTGYYGAVYQKEIVDDITSLKQTEYILVSEGSNTKLDDWLQNGLIGLNMRGVTESLPSQLKSILDFAEKAAKELDIEVSEFTFSGHSLGGILSNISTGTAGLLQSHI